MIQRSACHRRPSPPLMETIASCARRLAVSQSTVRHQVLQGKRAAVRIGGSWRLPLPGATTDDLPEYCSAREVANALDASEVTVRRWIASDHLRAIKTGRVWRVPQATLAELLAPSDAHGERHCSRNDLVEAGRPAGPEAVFAQGRRHHGRPLGGTNRHAG